MSCGGPPGGTAIGSAAMIAGSWYFIFFGLCGIGEVLFGHIVSSSSIS